MDNKPSPWPLALKFGLIAGLLNIIVSILFYLSDPHSLKTSGNWIQSIIGWTLLLVILIVAGKQRATELDNNFTYNNGFGFSFMVGLPYSFITMVYIFVYFVFMNPELLPKIQEAQLEALQAKGLSDEEIDAQMSMINKFNSPIVYAIFSCFASILQAVIIGLIAAIFTKKTTNQALDSIA